MARTIIISSAAELKSTVSDIMLLLEQTEGLSMERIYDIRLCLKEILSNSLVYSGSTSVELVYRFEKGSFRFSVTDNGVGFCHNKCTTCPDAYAESGRGIYIVRQLADEVIYNKKGTSVVVRFFY